MTKYEIVWASDLYKVFKKLIKKGAVKKDEIKSRRPKQKLKVESKRLGSAPCYTRRGHKF